ncbi:winged helix-turn-helix transcriptional regulator [Siphonobacter aquaeclarae]|uniref:Transcriptional regulator, HxlR family n=1 Tax=Siphonobacter aquaeclarae TaxID=563176 RepID=A0A1G9YSU9_9BACT|nr:helix-turn-helix domain-containing protein [Siphonobacter aquaeclarae]SDN12140.1 transcriptional regulator, HxlR family [Siphonobacter aquaeclarae]
MDEIGKTESQCPSDVFLKVLKGKCKTTIIVLIETGRNRFSEIRRTLPTISERMISKQLDELQKDGIIDRQVFGEVPPRVEYSLTEYGKTLLPIVRQMRKWGYIHLEKISKVSVADPQQ